MKKIIINLFLLIIITIIVLIVILSTIGIETNKFNNFISNKTLKTKNFNLKLKTIKFKINPKELSLFLETQNPKINYMDVSVPVQNIKVYIDFISLLKSDPKIKKTSLTLEELDITQLNNISSIMKPSNIKSLINNKIKKGKLISEIEIYLTEQGSLKNFIAKGSVKGLKAEIFEDLHFSQSNFNFFADKNDILIKNIFGNLDDIKISDGDIKLNLENGIKITSNFNSKINFDARGFKKYRKLLKKYDFTNQIKFINADFVNNLSINLDQTYKVKDYNYYTSGTIKKGKFELPKPINNLLIPEKIKEIYLSDLQVKMKLGTGRFEFNGDGKYSLNNLDFLKINFENNLTNDQLDLKLDLDYKNIIELDIINYKKNKNSVANLSLNLNKNKNNFLVNNLSFIEGKNSIKINGLKFKENKFVSLDKVEVETTNNDFFIKKGQKILIKGNKFDATNLTKYFNNQNDENNFKNFNTEIEIDFKDIKVPMSEKLENFKLLGEIKNGQFIKISSKGDFGGGNFLDISMKKDKNTNKKYLEIYSDLTRPLLSDYSFFNGLSGGKLLFTSIIDNTKSTSKLKIENFKVINAPGVIKLLSLADLGGLADLAEGEGLSFDILEIEMEKNNSFLKLNEILALGPSMSVLMEGYQDKNGVTSIRGTLVPAKTLNNIISKIPVIGNIVIPKEVGEGLFGISFKMKGPLGKIKTTINPLRTLTPRFIQKIIDKKKQVK